MPQFQNQKIYVVRAVQPLDAYCCVEKAAKTSWLAGPSETKEEREAFISKLIDWKHWSCMEFADVWILLRTSRRVTHEFVRHRHFSYLQESSRINYIEKFDTCFFIYPWWWNKVERGDERQGVFIRSCTRAEEDYRQWLKLGMKPHDASCSLNDFRKAELNVKGNIRCWHEFLEKRLVKGAFPQMKQLANMILKELGELYPVIFNDLEPIEEDSLEEAQ